MSASLNMHSLLVMLRLQWYSCIEITPFVGERWKDLITPKPSCSSNAVDNEESETETTQPPSTKALRHRVEKCGKGGEGGRV